MRKSNNCPLGTRSYPFCSKEREADAYRRRHQQDTTLPVPAREQPSSYRARSSSPTFPFTFSHPISTHSHAAPASRRDSQPITLPPLDMSPSVLVPHRTSKRSAYDAFSPATASASALPFKRAIPSPDSLSPGSDDGGYLASAYSADHWAGPRPDLKVSECNPAESSLAHISFQYLPYHTLASSPADDVRSRAVRKGVLRYHELQSPEPRPQSYPVLPPIRVPQSACTSPREYAYQAHGARHSSHAVPPPMSHHLTPPQMTIRTPPSYPASSPHIVVYTPPQSAYPSNPQSQPRPWAYARHAYADRDTDMADLSPQSEMRSEFEYAHRLYHRSPVCDRVVAPFANAGPPGVHWNHAPQAAVYQQPTPNWSPIRGRRL
jgi:hypothetical protein